MTRDYSESLQPKKPDIMPGLASLRQIGHDLPHHTTELVAMPREPGGNGHFRMFRMQVEDEVAIRTVGEQAPLEHQGRSCSIGEVALGKGA